MVRKVGHRVEEERGRHTGGIRERRVQGRLPERRPRVDAARGPHVRRKAMAMAAFVSRRVATRLRVPSHAAAVSCPTASKTTATVASPRLTPGSAGLARSPAAAAISHAPTRTIAERPNTPSTTAIARVRRAQAGPCAGRRHDARGDRQDDRGRGAEAVERWEERVESGEERETDGDRGAADRHPARGAIELPRAPDRAKPGGRRSRGERTSRTRRATRPRPCCSTVASAALPCSPGATITPRIEAMTAHHAVGRRRNAAPTPS